MEEEHRLVSERIRKLDEIKTAGVNPYPYSFEQKQHATDVLEKNKSLKPEQHATENISVAGRIMTLRRMGKASFLHIQDQTGKLQLYFREEDVGKEQYEIFRKVDLGDIIGAEGHVFATKTGEVTVYVKKFELLAKSLRPLPEKYHGLQDIELKYRERYLDLIMNPDSRKVFTDRTRIISSIRAFLEKKGYLEFETPTLQPVYGGAHAKPFETVHNELKTKLYLRISNELYLKRLLVGGFEKVFEFVKDFRNEGIDKTHNPEFTMLEFYCAYIDYNEIMDITEKLLKQASKEATGKTSVEYQGTTIDFSKKFERITMIDAIKKHAKIDVTKLSEEEIKGLVDENHVEYRGKFSMGLGIELLFEALVQKHLVQPTFVIDHPKESTPLCKESRNDPELIERLELFIAGMEIANGYSELNDPIKQRMLLEGQAKERSEGDEEANPMDEDFVKALEYAMPPAGGIGIGIDRFVMILTNQPSIRDVILFPTLKPK
ncbi:MAG: lysine--tRNA ligase [Candidatus Woesearchaeota archaeon]